MAAANAIPTYRLYGDTENWPVPELMHCESIPERSAIHDWTIRPHRHHDLFQMIYCRRGAVSLLLDGRSQFLRGPYLLTVPPLCVHGFEFERSTEGWVVTLPAFALKRFIEPSAGLLKHFDAPLVLCDEETHVGNSLDAMFERLAGEFLGVEPARLMALEACLALILVRIVREALSSREGQARDAGWGAERLQRFQELIEKSFREWRTMQAYATELGVTPAQLNTTCRALAGKSALQIVHERVLIEAKRSLVYTEMGVSEVAYALGFSDPAYFTRFFKKRVGQSPSAFRTARRVRVG